MFNQFTSTKTSTTENPPCLVSSGDIPCGNQFKIELYDSGRHDSEDRFKLVFTLIYQQFSVGRTYSEYEEAVTDFQIWLSDAKCRTLKV